MKRSSVIGFSVVAFLCGSIFGGALINHFRARPCNKAFHLSIAGNVNTLLGVLKRLRQERKDDAVALLEQSLEVQETLLEDLCREDPRRLEAATVLSRAREYRSVTSQTN